MLSFEWSHRRISSTDLKVRVALQNSIKHSGSERVRVLHCLLSFSTFGGSVYLGAALPLTSPFVIKMVLRHLSFPFLFVSY